MVGSTSPHKLEAVREACRILGLSATVDGAKTLSGQSEQPVGFDETFRGAINRATSIKIRFPRSIAIGIESGIFRFLPEAPTTLDIAAIVLLTPDGREVLTTSEGVQFPEHCVKVAEDCGFLSTTVGSIVAESIGGDPTDPHATLTNGRVTRAMTLVNALKTALLQL